MIMKRTLHILSYIVAAACTISCVKEIERPDAPSSEIEASGEKATFTFTPSFLDEAFESGQTKTMGSRPQIHNLFFAVFDNAGYKLSEYAQAIPNTYADENWNPEHPDDNVFSYSVTLTVTDQPRIIHVIANAPEHLLYGSEAEVIGSLNTRFNATETEEDWSDAYWVRIYLDNGVWTKPDESTKETDAKYQEKYDKWMHVVQTLNNAKFVRNFARITLEETADNFEITRYWINNIPDIGSFAPYNRNTGRFQIDYSNYSTIEDISSPEGGNYPGFFPASANLIQIGDYLDDPEMMEKLESNAGKNWTNFCYEREFPKADPIYLIVAGRYNGGAESFYKIDLRDHSNKYFPLLRNFTYKVRITNVSTNGASSLSKALSNAPSGAVDTSLEMQNLTNISNGTAQMFVSETSEIVVGEGHDIPLRYKFIPNLATDANHDGFADAVNTIIEKGSAEEAAAIANHSSYVTITNEFGSTGSVFASITPTGETDSDNYNTIILHSKDANEVIHTETVTITGYYFNSETSKYESISRSSHFRLRETLHMNVSFSPEKIPAGNGQPVDLVISLEAGLPSSMFSLDFNIEMLGLTLTTNNDPLPITTGESQIAGNTKPAYHFQRTITWSEYESAPVVDGLKQFVCHFKTNTSTIPSLNGKQTIYANVGGDDTLPEKNGDIVSVKNKYFVDEAAFYSIYSPKEFTNITITNAAEVGQSGVLTFTMESPLPNGATSTVVTVGLQGFEPEDIAAYPIKGTKEGYELYELTVYNTVVNGVPAYQGRLNIVPFESGNCAVKLYADEYTPKSQEANVLEGIYIYVNESGTGSGNRLVQATGYNVVPEGSLVVGQKATLTAYIADLTTETVKFGDATATRDGSAGNSVVIDGKRYYRYYVNYQAPTSGAQRVSLNITIDGKVAKRISIPVYGIQLGEASTERAHNAYTTNWYVFRNREFTGYHIVNNGSKLLGSNATLDYYSLIGFDSSSNTSKVMVPTDSGLKYVKTSNSNNTDLSLDTQANGSSYTIGTGVQLSVQPSYFYTFYWRQNSSTGNIQGNRNNNNYRNFNTYVVTLKQP